MAENRNKSQRSKCYIVYHIWNCFWWKYNAFTCKTLLWVFFFFLKTEQFCILKVVIDIEYILASQQSVFLETSLFEVCLQAHKKAQGTFFFYFFIWCCKGVISNLHCISIPLHYFQIIFNKYHLYFISRPTWNMQPQKPVKRTLINDHV